MGDQGYDRDKIRKMLSQQGIPPRRCRKKPVHYSKRLYRKGHKIENLYFPTEELAAHCSPLRPLHPRLLLCHPLGRHCHLLVISPDPLSREGAPREHQEERWVMAQLLGLSAEQVDGIRPLLPKERGVKRVEDRKVLSGIITCHSEEAALGVDAPAADGPHKTLYNRCRRW